MPDISAAEWLALANKFLPEKRIASLRHELEEGVREKLKSLQAELDSLAGNQDRRSNGAAKHQADPPPDEATVVQLVEKYAGDHPGSKAADFVTYVLKHRRDAKAMDVHTALYRLSKPDGPQTLRKEGERPHTRFFLRRQ